MTLLQINLAVLCLAIHCKSLLFSTMKFHNTLFFNKLHKIAFPVSVAKSLQSHCFSIANSLLFCCYFLMFFIQKIKPPPKGITYNS